MASNPSGSDESPQDLFDEFVNVIKALRTPGTGCPWDLKQNHHTLRKYLIEESHEVLEAIDRNHDGDLCDELGDLLLQVVLHAQIAADRQAFTIRDIIRGITAKMIRRHPHVFGNTTVSDSDEVLTRWEEIKQQERKTRDQSANQHPLEAIPTGLPALLRAQKVLEKANKLGIGPPDNPPASANKGFPDAITFGEEILSLVARGMEANFVAEDCLREAVGRWIKNQTATNPSPSE